MVKTQAYGLANIEHGIPVTTVRFSDWIVEQAVHRDRDNAAGSGS
jgi:hypothetical protein